MIFHCAFSFYAYVDVHVSVCLCLCLCLHVEVHTEGDLTPICDVGSSCFFVADLQR